MKWISFIVMLKTVHMYQNVFWTSLLWLISKRFFFISHISPTEISPCVYKAIQIPAQSCISPELRSSILWYLENEIHELNFPCIHLWHAYSSWVDFPDLQGYTSAHSTVLSSYDGFRRKFEQWSAKTNHDSLRDFGVSMRLRSFGVGRFIFFDTTV